MHRHLIEKLLALIGGLLLALMIYFNSLIAQQSSPLFAAWITHGVGTIAALFLGIVLAKVLQITNKKTLTKSYAKPIWTYLGGIPGALAVVFAAMTINSSLGLSGTLALMLVGQVSFGIFVDIFGLFGNPKRILGRTDFYVVISVLTGSLIIIFFKA